jgi:DNA-binding transcriptional LysR family regulator
MSTVRLHASAALAPAIRLALDGIAVAVMPPAIVREELRSRRLMKVETDLCLPELAFVASWPIAPGTMVAERVAALAAETAAASAATFGEAP